jgi:tripartite-type tricarboxylate transporter receptor subunit TctC
MRTRRRPRGLPGIVAFVAVAAGAALAASLALAAYPERPVKLIIPWAAGGDTDATQRPFAELAKKYFDQPLVVANITGASGTVGAREAKGAPPDGYTIFSIHDYIHTTYWTGVSEISYTDFDPVCLVTTTPEMLAATAKAPWSSLKELIEDAKKRPGEITVGATLGSTSHLFPAKIEKLAGIKFKYVSYEGLAPRMTAILGGHIQVTQSNLTQLDKAKAGQLKFLGMATAARHPEAPDVPTLREQGVDLIDGVNRGYVVPKGTPEAAMVKLEDLCQKVTKDPAYVEAMRKQGTDVSFLGRKAYAEFMTKQDAVIAEIAQALGFKRKS